MKFSIFTKIKFWQKNKIPPRLVYHNFAMTEFESQNYPKLVDMDPSQIFSDMDQNSPKLAQITKILKKKFLKSIWTKISGWLVDAPQPKFEVDMGPKFPKFAKIGSSPKFWTRQILKTMIICQQSCHFRWFCQKSCQCVETNLILTEICLLPYY